MSAQDVKGFLEKIAADEKLRDEMVAAVKGAADRMATVASVAERNGYRFAATELEQIMDAAESAGELTDDQMDRIVGGTLTTIPALTRDELNAVAAGREVLQQIMFAPPFVATGPPVAGDPGC